MIAPCAAYPEGGAIAAALFTLGDVFEQVSCEDCGIFKPGSSSILSNNIAGKPRF